MICPDCRGFGLLGSPWVISDTCSRCRGLGLVHETAQAAGEPCPRDHGDECAQPGPECGAGKLPGEVGFRPEVYRREIEEDLLDRCIAAIKAMPDSTGQTARPDGLTHCCAGCGTWLAEDDLRRPPDRYGTGHSVPGYDRHGEVTHLLCGPVHDMSPSEDVLRADVVAALRRVIEEGR